MKAKINNKNVAFFKDIKIGDYFMYDEELYIKNEENRTTNATVLKTGDMHKIDDDILVIGLGNKFSLECKLSNRKTIHFKKDMVAGNCILLSSEKIGLVTYYGGHYFEYYGLDLQTGKFHTLETNIAYNVLEDVTITLG